MRGRCVCTAFRSSHARLGAANPEKWHRYSVRKGAPTARVPSLGCLAALVPDPKANETTDGRWGRRGCCCWRRTVQRGGRTSSRAEPY